MDLASRCFFPGCAICGLRIRKKPTQHNLVWLSKYRVLYGRRAHEHPVTENIKVSGIGMNRLVPSYHYIYATRDYTNQLEFPFRLLNNDAYETVDLKTSTAYLFHDSCWTLLERSYAPFPVPLKDLYHTCRSMKFDTANKLIDWGHDYSRFLQTPHPRDEGQNDLRIANESELSDPLGSIEAGSWLVDDDLVRRVPSSMGEYSTVCVSPLGSFPAEIRDTIVDHLPARDVLSLGIGCRAFLPILYDEVFYKRQFCPGGDRAWLFEAEAIRQAKGWTWRQLFHLTSRRYLASQLSMLNRSRVWELIRFVQMEVSKFKASSKRKYSSASGWRVTGTAKR